MATIDNLDLSVYNLYAIRTKMMEQINQDLRLDQAGSIPPQTAVVDIYPRMSELDILLGITPAYMPWAYFFPPKRFRRIRRSPFTFARIIPSFGSDDDIEVMQSKLGQIPTSSTEEDEEKTMISKCLGKIIEINEWMAHIVGRVGQFLQG